MKRNITWLAVVVLGVAASLAATGAASAAGTTQVDGMQTLASLGDPLDPADDGYWMSGYGDGRPALIGWWRTTSFQLGVITPSGVVTGTGTEEFEGCLDANGDASCGGSEPAGTLRFSFESSAKYDLVTFAQEHGRCHHPITGGTGDFAGATGVLTVQGRPGRRVLVLLRSPDAGGMSATARRPGALRPPHCVREGDGAPCNDHAGGPVAVQKRIAAGDLVAGYEVGALAGRGGMGEVYRALDLRLERPVALKLLSERLSDDEAFRDRMLRESRLAASLDHPNVVPIYEAGEADGRLFIAMRYVDGTDLKALLAAGGRARAGARRRDRRPGRGRPRRGARKGARPPRREAVQRPARPAGRPRARLSRRLRADAERSATSGRPTGSSWEPSTMSRPSRSAATRSTGAPTCTRSAACCSRRSPATLPFTGASDVAVVYAHLEEEPPRVSERRPELPVDIDDVLARAMAKDPVGRQPTCGDAGRRGAGGTRSRPSRRRPPAPCARCDRRGRARRPSPWPPWSSQRVRVPLAPPSRGERSSASIRRPTA